MHCHTVCAVLQGMKGWVFLLPTVTKEDADTYFPDHKTCDVPSGKGEHVPSQWHWGGALAQVPPPLTAARVACIPCGSG